MATYNPENAFTDQSKTKESRPYKGVQVCDISRLKDMPITDSVLLWTPDRILADGNVVYIEGGASDRNPFVYRDDTTRGLFNSPSSLKNSYLISVQTEEHIPFTDKGTLDTSEVNGLSYYFGIHPVADDHILQHIGEEEKIVIHEI